MDAEPQLEEFIGRYSPGVAADARHALAVLSRQFPTATRIVYDNYNALAVGFSASDRAGEAILSIAVYPKYVSLFLLRGASLADPGGVLEGTGSRVRHIKLRPISRLEATEVRALIDAAVTAAPTPFPRHGKGPLIIKAIAAKQRPRWPGP
jgi:hypothetical protein